MKTPIDTLDKEKIMGEFPKYNTAIPSSLCARLERVEKFFLAFSKAIDGYYNGSDKIPLGNWSDGVDRMDFARLQREHGYESIAMAPKEMERIRRAFHESIAKQMPVKDASRVKRALKDLRSLARCETMLLKNSSKSVITYRLLAVGVIDKHRDRNSIVTNHEIFDSAFADALAKLTHQIGVVRRLAIISLRERDRFVKEQQSGETEKS